jgi:xanthine dehydrogenase/oxidase
LVFFLNGEKVTLDNPDPCRTLSDYLRNDAGLTGVKIGCGFGMCGACTVMVSSYDHSTSTISHRAVNACIFPLSQLHHRSVTTIEGLGNTRGK